MTRLLLVFLGLSVWTNGAGTYYGSLEDCKKPAQVVARTVFAEIPEYREIKRKGLDDTDAEYWLLLAKANDEFYKAVGRVAEQEKYGCVVEKGSSDEPEVGPDITQEVIRALSN